MTDAKAEEVNVLFAPMQPLVPAVGNAPLRKLRAKTISSWSSFWVHFYALSLKNWRVQSRRWKGLLMFVLSPAAFVMILYMVKRCQLYFVWPGIEFLCCLDAAFANLSKLAALPTTFRSRTARWAFH
jgi:hypothetical protein